MECQNDALGLVLIARLTAPNEAIEWSSLLLWCKFIFFLYWGSLSHDPNWQQSNQLVKHRLHLECTIAILFLV